MQLYGLFIMGRYMSTSVSTLNPESLTVGSWPLQGDIGAKHESISQLHSRIQNLTDLTVQAQYNSTHGLPIIVEQATKGTKIAQQVSGQAAFGCCQSALDLLLSCLYAAHKLPSSAQCLTKPCSKKLTPYHRNSAVTRTN